MQVAQIGNGVVCLWDEESAVVVDVFTGAQLSCIRADACYSTSASGTNRNNNNNNNSSSDGAPSRLQLQYVGACAASYAASANEDDENDDTDADSLLRRRRRQTKQRQSVISLVFQKKGGDGGGDLVIVFAVAETGEILGSTSFHAPASGAAVRSAACVPSFPSAQPGNNNKSKNKKKKSVESGNNISKTLATATCIVFVVNFTDGQAICGRYSRRGGDRKQQQEQQDLVAPLSLSPFAITNDGTAVLDFALSIDRSAGSNQDPLLHTVEVATNNANNNAEGQELVIKEYRYSSSSRTSPFVFAWASTSFCTIAAGAAGSSSPSAAKKTAAKKTTQQQQQHAVSVAESIVGPSVMSSNNNNNKTSGHRCFLRVDSRHVDAGTFICYCVTALGVVTVVLTPESTTSFAYTFSALPRGNSNSGRGDDICGVQLIEKPGSPGTVGIVATMSSGVTGVAWLAFSSRTVPVETLHDSWSDSATINTSQQQQCCFAITTAPSTAATTSDDDVSLAAAAAADVSDRAEVFLARFAVSSASNNTNGTNKRITLRLAPIGFAAAAPKNAIVVDESALEVDSARWNPSRLWGDSRDIVTASCYTVQLQQQQQQHVRLLLVTLRVESDAARVDLETAQWLRWHRVGEYLAVIARQQPTLLFLSGKNLLQQQQQQQQQQQKQKRGSTSDEAAAVEDEGVSSSRWPTPVLRTALRALGADAVRRLVAGLLQNLDSAALHGRSFSFALACAVKVAESCIIMQRALGVDLSAELVPFAEKLRRSVEDSWSELGSAGQRIAAATALGRQGGGGGTSAVNTEDLLMEQALLFEPGSLGSSAVSVDDAASVVARLKKRHNIPNDLFA